MSWKSEYKDGGSQPVVVVKGEEDEADTLKPSLGDIPPYTKPKDEKIKEEAEGEDAKAKVIITNSSLSTPSPPSHATNRIKTRNTHPHIKMSNSQTTCTFGDLAVSYRVYILDDLLAEPQEVCHDWSRHLLYVAQRHRQGNAYAPIEDAHEIAVVDLATAEVGGVIDLGPGYSAPYALELDPDAAYLSARVREGMVWVEAESRCVTNFADRSQIASAHAAGSAPGSSASGAGSSSRHGRHGHGHGHSRNSSSSSSSNSNNSFIAEVDLRSGKIRQRIMVPDSEKQDPDLGLVVFSSPAIRFAGRQSSDGMPLVSVEEDPVVAAIRYKFGVRTIYITSRDVMLV